MRSAHKYSGERPYGERPLVLSIHGIRTTGQWQDDLAETLDKNGFRHRPLNFGFFRAVSLVLPWARQSKVDWFLKEIHWKTNDVTQPPSIIAHSFGTYLLTRALEKQALLKFDRIILCGSIVREDYPWTAIVEGKQANFILNEAGGEDFWCGLVGWVVSDAGASGVVGFDDKADGRVLQLRHELHRHSDYFSELNYKERWIPFLKGISPQVPTKRPKKKINRRFATAMFALVLVVVSFAYWFVNRQHVSIPAIEQTAGASSTSGQDLPIALPTARASSAIAADPTGNSDRDSRPPLDSTEPSLANPPNSASTKSGGEGARLLQTAVIVPPPAPKSKIKPSQEIKRQAATAPSSSAEVNAARASTGDKTAMSTFLGQAKTKEAGQGTTAKSPVVIAGSTWTEKCYDTCHKDEHACEQAKEFQQLVDKWSDNWLQHMEGNSAAANFSKQTMEKYEERRDEAEGQCLANCDKKCDR